MGLECKAVVCPKWLAKCDKRIVKLCYVVYEQVVIPLRSMTYDVTIYPYNSASITGAFSSRSLLVVHDFVPNKKRNRSFAALYIRVTQAIHSVLCGDVAYVSKTTAEIGRRTNKFRHSRTFLFPNSFYLFERNLESPQRAKREYVLLCTGWGVNKDLAGALELYRQSELFDTRELRILGISGHQEIVDAFRARYPQVGSRISVLPRLSDSELVAAYEEASWTWVHSLEEGYGRSIAEARLCGSRVVASNIAPFREQADDATFYYVGLKEFKSAVARCEAYPACAPRRIPPEHDILHAEIRRFLGSKEL